MTVLNFSCGGQVFQVHLPAHHAAHEWRNGVPPSDAITFHPRMFGMMRGVVISGSVLIKISPFYYLKDGAFHVFPETTLNTTPYLAVAANKVRLAVVGFNIDTEALEVYTGSEVVFSALTPPPLPTGMPTGFFPSFLVRLRYNTTELFETDLTDARFALMETGGGGGAPTGAAGGVLAGTYPNPSFAVDMATQAELDAHVNDSADAHDASAISSVPAGSLAATTVQAALDELDTEKSATSHTHTLGWPGAGKAMINDVEYATIPDAITAAATGDIIKVGQGTFTLADTLTLNKNVTLKGLSPQDTIITQSVGIRTILASGAGAVIEDLTVINTRTTGTVYGITASANCRIARVITSSTGAATDGNGINVSGATVDLIDVEATASGATNNYGLYIQNSGVVNVYRGTFGGATANIFVDTGTLSLFNPVLTNNLITGTFSGTYLDSDGDVRQATATDLYPQASANGLNTRFERLFGDDKPGAATNWQINPFTVDAVASNVLGFETNTTIHSDSYTPSSPFSKSNSGSVYFYTQNHHLITNSLSGTATLIWTSATARTRYEIFGMLGSRAGVTYGAELRLWAIQSPVAGTHYWAFRWIYNATTYPQWPWRIQLWSGTGVTFSATDGTMTQDAPQPFPNALKHVVLTQAGPRTDMEITGEMGGWATGLLTGTVASKPTDFKTAYLHFPTSFVGGSIDSIILT